MVREAWTDERLDDLTKHMDEGFREVRADIRQQREEMTTGLAAVQNEMKAVSTSLRSEIAAAQNEMKAESTSLRSEIAAVREGLNEVKEQVARIDARIDELARTMQIGFWLIGSFLVGLMGMFATQL